MSKRFFDYDPLTGKTEWFEDLGKDGFAIHSEMDVEPILEANKARQSMGRAYYAKDPDMWHLASVPNILLLQWAQEYGIPPDKVFSDEFAEITGRKLASSEFRYLKTADVRL